MGFRTTLVLLLLALGVGGYLYFAEPAESPDVDFREEVVKDYSVAQAEWIQLRRNDGTPALEFRRRADGWWLEEPVEDYASNVRLQSLGNALDGTTLTLKYDLEEFRKEQGEEAVQRFLQEAGLRPTPRGRIELRFPSPGWARGEGSDPAGGAEGSRVRVLEIGNRGSVDAEVYVLRDGKVFGGGMALWSSMSMTANDAREKLLFFHDGNSARSVRAQFRQANGEMANLVLERQRGKAWRLVEPMNARVDQGSVGAFLQLLLSLKARDFLNGALQPAAVRPDQPEPDWVIDVEGVLAREDRVELWTVGSEMIGRAASRTSGFQVEPGDVQRVFQDAVPKLRARWIQPHPIQDLKAIQLDPPGGQGVGLRLESQGADRYRMVAPHTLAVDPTAMGEFRRALKDLRADGFVEGDPEDPRFGLNEGFWNLSLEPRRGSPIRVRLGAPDGDAYPGDFVYVRRADEDEILLVEAKTVAGLTPDWRKLASRDVVRITAAVTSLEIREAKSGGAVVLWGLQDQGWVRQGAGGVEPLAGEVVDELRELTGTGVVGRAGWDAVPGRLFEILLGRNSAGGGAGDVLQTFVLKVPKDPEAPALIQLGGQDTVSWRLRRLVSDPIRRLLPGG